MKILLSYSRLHFDPEKNPKDHKYWGSSASILARTLFEILSKIGQVTYIDSSEYKKVEGLEFDLFVGISNHFYKILRSAKIKKSIFFAVNMHPRERNGIILKFLLKERLNPQALSGWDLMNFFEAEKGINAANYILSIGSMVAYNSYIKYGVPKSKIKMLNYGVDLSYRKITKLSGNNIKRYVYVTSEIGLRKGFDIVYSLFTDQEILKQEFYFDIVGSPTNNYYNNKLIKFQQILRKKVNYHGWIDSNSPKYWEIIKRSDFVILPSLEEGQAGSLLDAISIGVIPITSQNTGIDFSPIGNLDLKIISQKNLNIIIKSLSKTANEVRELKNKTLEYYSEYHADFKESIENSIKDCISGEPYPKVSIVLSIFNKEKTIKPLLLLLHKACSEYKNVEVHIIFDGCTDSSEDIVRNFYRDIRSYKGTFEKTSNIFEVKSNNIGLKKSIGKYCVILQDDNYIFDKNIFFEAVNFLEKNSKVAILGGLAGVNFYPRGTKLKGTGQIAMNKHEVYWRQDKKTNPELKGRIFEVDAVMRGPLFFRKVFLEKYGYLDEIYSPFYMDDMDICFRAHKYGFKVYAILFDAVNASLSIAKYDKKKWKFWNKVISRNSDIFYSRWKPTQKKDYLWLQRSPVKNSFIERLFSDLNKAWLHRSYIVNFLASLKLRIII